MKILLRPFAFLVLTIQKQTREQRDLAAKKGINTENKQKVAVRILNLNIGESYTGRLSITGNHQIYLPTETQKMLEGAGRIRVELQ